ncbi:stealth family protein [Rathayibacter sp. KR2-224]|uniref:stealth family protein n=1 Tax=Rathayibacter sp. KR2-224 TaxID=3400913 RepID=UPI003C0CBB29
MQTFEDVTGPSVSGEPEPVIVSVPERMRRFDREDVVLRNNEYALRNTFLTPRESMVEDLLAVRDALDAAGVRYLLIRSDDERPVLAIARSDRKAVDAALASAFANEPFYAKPLEKGARRQALLADGVLGDKHNGSVFRIYRPRIEPIGRLRYGPGTAFQLELWRIGDNEIVAPRPNALTRERLPLAEAIDDEVELYGRTWPTLQNMFAPLVNAVDFEIDMVFSWVDGSSEEYQRARAERMKAYVVGEGDDSPARYRQIDELKYALRSVHLFAPWVRHIFIATDSPRPEWLAQHPRVSIVRSEEFFADTSVLPTHNSQAVESQLHRIPGLAEHFLYSNDDMFFGRAVSPALFFSPGGVTKFVQASTRIGLGENAAWRSGFENAARVNRRLLRERFGKIITRHLEHCAAPFRKSVSFELEQEFAEEFARTAGSRFRSASDISVTNSLYHYYALLKGHAVEQTQARVQYIETTLARAEGQMARLLKRRDQDMFCLNDGSTPEVSDEQRTTIVRDFLQRYFPIPAPWEK